jgi:ADP-ribose pyrophosphatase YjhB (NUDIX family)
VLASDERGRVLLIRQSAGPYAGALMLPGGGIEPGERASEAAAREFREETGLEPADLRYFATYEERGRWDSGDFHVLLLVFRAAADGDPRPSPGEGEAVWSDPRALASPHPVLLRVLVDAGLADGDVDGALARAGVRMERVDR